MNEVTLAIDGRPIVAAADSTILQAALSHDIFIPNLCHYPGLSPAGVCRLCLVDLSGETVLACRTRVGEGMEIATRTPEIDRLRRITLEILVANHHRDCRGCPGNRRCALQGLMAACRIDRKRVGQFRPPKETLPVDDSHPRFVYDPNRCVLCGICVKTCVPIQQALHVLGRGPKTRISFYGDVSRCESCGECVNRCPVAALFFTEDRGESGTARGCAAAQG